MSVGNTLLQLICCYYSWCLYRQFQCWICCTFTLVFSEVRVQCPILLLLLCGSFRPYLSQRCSVPQYDVAHIDNDSQGDDEDSVHTAQDDGKVAPVKCHWRAVHGVLWPGCCITVDFENWKTFLVHSDENLCVRMYWNFKTKFWRRGRFCALSTVKKYRTNERMFKKRSISAKNWTHF